MQFTFRWFGDDDPVTLENIRQIPAVTGIVGAVYDVPAGEVWPSGSITSLKSKIEDAGLSFEVVESVPVHEDIKLGRPTRDRLIANYCENIERLATAGVKCVCYNFMPVFDWTRTTMKNRLADGSSALAYFKKDLVGIDPFDGRLNLPGWDESYRPEEIRGLFHAYESVGSEELYKNLVYFLRGVIPTAEKSGIRMAIHPDDPPYPVFGLPRIITCEENIARLLKDVDSPSNGITFCTGSLGATDTNDIYAMLDRFTRMGKVYFVHARNIRCFKDGSFEERAHNSASGSFDMVRIMKILKKNGFDGYIRPDHGRMIWGETGRYGYGLYDRALGVSYLSGIWEAINHEE